VEIGLEHLAPLARGCAVLGTGGGGATYTGMLMAIQAISDHGPATLVDLDDLPDDALVMPCGKIGAPTVSIEKICNGNEGPRLLEHVERLTGRKVAALMAAEIGGSNGMVPLTWGAMTGVPVVDADGMGRAFPEVPMVSMHVAEISPNPCVMTDERGNVIVFDTRSGAWAERLARTAAVAFGGSAASAEYLMSAAEARAGAAVRGTVSLALKIGQTLDEAEGDPVEALCQEIGAEILIRGKVADVERRTTGGFARGSVILEGTGADAGRLVRIEIQNENLVALEDGKVLASVPDLITLLDDASADAIATELVRYGQRVVCIAFACDPIWRSPRGIELAGPRAFGYDFDYVTIEERRASRA